MPQEKKQKTATTRKDRDEAGVEPRDQRDKELGDETSAVLDDIACCLAEVEEEENRAARQKAKDEWDENTRKFREGEIRRIELRYIREAWALKYRHMFEIGVECCGGELIPDFSGLE